MAERKHFVTFYSPGTFFFEETTKPIDSWDPVAATAMASDVVERYGAVPFGFEFSTRLVADPIPDGEGGELAVEPRTVETSGRYYIEGKLETLDELEARSGKSEGERERILRSNMSGNREPIAVVVVRGYKSAHFFREKDFTVDAAGSIVERGDDPRHVEYRARTIARLEAERA